MKHLVQIHVTPEAGLANEARPGGPHPIFVRIAERFKPEALYVSPAKRAIFMVCDLAPADMAELMLIGDEFAGQHPDFIPVVSGKEFAPIIAQAQSATRKLIDG